MDKENIHPRARSCHARKPSILNDSAPDPEQPSPPKINLRRQKTVSF